MTQAERKRSLRQTREEQGLCVYCGLNPPESPRSPRYKDTKSKLCERCRTQARQANRRCYRRRVTSKQSVTSKQRVTQKRDRVERMMELVDGIVTRFRSHT